MRIDLLSLFPGYFESPLNETILKRAIEKGILDIRMVDIRSFAKDKHSQVDDRPYGGGPGMVLMPGPVTEAIRSVKGEKSHVVYLSPQGAVFNADKAKELAKKEHLILLAGHYEGVDERVIDQEVDEEVSIGDYVLTNGCLAALVVIDAMSRFIAGVLGHEEASYNDSFEKGRFDHPHYTRPSIFEGKEVPAVLLSGDHGRIAEWRLEKALKKTKNRRPELLSG